MRFRSDGERLRAGLHLLQSLLRPCEPRVGVLELAREDVDLPSGVRQRLGVGVNLVLDLLTLKFLSSYSTTPIYLFGGMGAFSIFLSGLVLLLVTYQKFFEDLRVNRNPLFILSMGMFLLAVQFLALGLLAEIMVRTYFESRHKSSYLIGERIGFEPATPQVEMHVEPWVRESQSRGNVKQGT